MARKDNNAGKPRYWPRFLFLIPFVAVLWVPFYNRIEPSLGGIPFFYWYQLLWIVLGAATVLTVYLLDKRINREVKDTSGEIDSDGAPGGVM
jgi:hypothetical protein